MQADSPKASNKKLGAARGAVEYILGRLARIGAFLNPRRRYPESDIAAESQAESAAAEVEVVANANETFVATTVTTASSASASTGDAKRSEAEVNLVASILPDQQEIQRRRDLVRALFNDFWSVPDEKPRTFVDRLDQAEKYINERLTVCGECWQLDTKTRVMLALPPRSN
jgi:hypothetical protein